MNGPPARAGFLATMRAVLWSFVGVRKRSAYHEDARSLDPKAVIAAGLLAAALFVLLLVLVVNWVVAG